MLPLLSVMPPISAGLRVVVEEAWMTGGTYEPMRMKSYDDPLDTIMTDVSLWIVAIELAPTYTVTFAPIAATY